MRILLSVLACILFTGSVLAQEYDPPQTFALVSYDPPTSFELISEPIQVEVVPPQPRQIVQTPPRIVPRQVRQPQCHFTLRSSRWYFSGSDLAGHVMGTHGRTVRNVFGYSNDQVRRMTRNQLVVLHSNAHEWERGRRWRLG